MRVLLVPGYDGNPYLAELAGALRSRGVEVDGVGGLGPAALRERVRLFARYDVVHVHWTHGYIEARSRSMRARKAVAFLFAVAVARTRGTRFVWTVHNVFAHRKPDPMVERAFGRVFMGLSSRWIVHCAAAAAEVSAAYGLRRRARRKAEVIPHGHYVGSYPSGTSRADARRALRLARDEVVFLHLGQVMPYKGIERLLDCWVRLKESNARLVIAGKPKGGAYGARIEARAAQMRGVTTFLKRVPDEEIQTYMAAADAVVLPYDRILTSGTTVLAMSFGRPVVTPDLGCAREMLSQQSGLLYDASDPAGLERALRRALEADLDSFGAANLEAARRAGWDVVGECTAAVYDKARGPSGG